MEFSNSTVHRKPHLTLFAAFSCWKLLLGAIAISTPSPAYDTSTSLLLPQPQFHDGLGSAFGVHAVRKLCECLTRWDAIYFAGVAQRGYLNEQEWAFGWGYTQAVSAIRKVLFSIFPVPNELGGTYPGIISALLLSNACHLASVFALYRLTLLCSNSSRRSKELAWLASALHILSPAGLFLSAPYSESLFSFLTFTGNYLYALSLRRIAFGQHISANTITLCSALVFAAASTVRSNGLLNGILFAVDFAPALLGIGRTGLQGFIRVVVLGISGLFVGLGVVLPQYIAWTEYCTEGTFRPWCAKLVPSIYTYVQDYYWNVGMFRYWTLSNLPLFLLAAPALFVLLRSGLWGAQQREWHSEMVSRLAVIQILLAGMSIVGYHVQVITRLSSGCVVWYWWVSVNTLGEGVSKARTNPSSKEHRITGSGWILRWMVMYGLIQGVLFAGFLPPA